MVFTNGKCLFWVYGKQHVPGMSRLADGMVIQKSMDL